MANSPDHPELAFVQAKEYARGRPDGLPLWIVVHDMEAGETRTRAESTAAYFATLPDGRVVSSHYCADNDSVVQCVRLGDVAFTVGNRTGNYRGINWEFSGFAAQTRVQWLDEFGRAMFGRAAPIIRADAARFDIPLVRRTVTELQALKPGVTSHNDLRLAFGRTTHTDPGPNFPWDWFMALLTDGDDEMAGEANAYNGDAYLNAVLGMRPTAHVIGTALDDRATVESPNELAAFLRQLDAKLGQVLEALQGGVTVPAKVDLSDAAVEAVADAVADEQAERLAPDTTPTGE